MATANADNLVVPLWIDGKECLASSTFDVVDPKSGKPCWSSASASTDDALRAVETAQVAFTSWSKTKPTQRIDILLKAAKLLEENAAEYGGYMSTEMGAETSLSQGLIIPTAVTLLKDLAHRAGSICGTVPVCQEEGKSCIVYKEPYGVTLGIVPWNAPFVFGVRSAGTAIATGNTAILKASELTPRCYWAIGKVFHDAGLPAGVLSVLSCPPSKAEEIVNTIIEHPAVRKINFTGSATIGRKVARTCGLNLKPCLMELGGKNSAIVLDDADIDLAVNACLVGAFVNAGQVCVATAQILVHEAISTKFIETIQATAAKMASSGSPLPVVATAASKARIQKELQEAFSKGAGVVAGGENPVAVPGNAIIPTVLKGIDPSTTMAKEETFGPIVAYAPIENEQQAIELVNRSQYGLSASVFTKDLRRALAIAKQLQTGAVHINSMTIHNEIALPFGGVKNSGWGRFNAEQGMDEFLVTKGVTWDD